MSSQDGYRRCFAPSAIRHCRELEAVIPRRHRPRIADRVERLTILLSYLTTNTFIAESAMKTHAIERGEKCYNARLTEEQVRLARIYVMQGPVGVLPQLARKWGVGNRHYAMQ
jgi:hypothetical protein